MVKTGHRSMCLTNLLIFGQHGKDNPSWNQWIKSQSIIKSVKLPASWMSKALIYVTVTKPIFQTHMRHTESIVTTSVGTTTKSRPLSMLDRWSPNCVYGLFDEAEICPFCCHINKNGFECNHRKIWGVIWMVNCSFQIQWCAVPLICAEIRWSKL